MGDANPNALLGWEESRIATECIALTCNAVSFCFFYVVGSAHLNTFWAQNK